MPIALTNSETTVAIMQPYLFPYLGYWQLFTAADHFIILDDVNFIVRGFINRNSILVNGSPFRFTLPVKSASQNKRICDLQLVEPNNKLLNTLRMNYAKALNFDWTMQLVESLLKFEDRSLNRFIGNTLRTIKDALGIGCIIHYSSEIDSNPSSSGQDRIIELVKSLSGQHYVNPIGGKSIYQPDVFKNAGIKLSFLSSNPHAYDQGQPDFVPNLSILDVLMHNRPEQTRKLLAEYELI